MTAHDQGRKFFTTEISKYAGKFDQICGSNMQLNMHFMQKYTINRYNGELNSKK